MEGEYCSSSTFNESLLNFGDPVPNFSEVLESRAFMRSVDINGEPSSNLEETERNNSELERILAEENPLPFTLTNWNVLTSRPRLYRGPSSDGLDTIPEHQITESPAVFQPLVPPAVPIPVTSAYNISFPTTLQLREPRNHQRFCPLGPNIGQDFNHVTKIVIPNTTESRLEQESPIHDNDDNKSIKSNKKSRRSTPNGSVGGTDFVEELLDEIEPLLEEKRQRKKCLTSHPTPEHRRRDSIKLGLDELQRVLPHLGSPEAEKISHASILHEAGKFIKRSQESTHKTSDSIDSLKHEIDRLNQEIENFQSQLPENGVALTPKVLALRTLADRFHDHVVTRTLEDWRYWVFTNIMGHFVHSFDQEVSILSHETLKESSIQWISRNMSLQQLRKDAYRKLAKLCAKTSIVDNPSKLPAEAIGFVSKRDPLIYKKST